MRIIQNGKERVNMHLKSDVMKEVRMICLEKRIKIGDYVSSALRWYIDNEKNKHTSDGKKVQA